MSKKKKILLIRKFLSVPNHPYYIQYLSVFFQIIQIQIFTIYKMHIRVNRVFLLSFELSKIKLIWSKLLRKEMNGMKVIVWKIVVIIENCKGYI